MKITGDQRRNVKALLDKAGFNHGITLMNYLAGDGSDRTFLRIASGEDSLLAIVPDLKASHGLKEANASWNIGRHLMDCNVPVPMLYGYDPETGVILCEDLGNLLLHQAMEEENWSEDKIINVYEQVVGILVHMQVAGGRDFQPVWCWDTGKYDRELMLARESGYFLSACCLELLGIPIPAGLDEEFFLLADLASSAPTVFFLHRDFQSRNIMIHQDRLRVIDFQGGRLGPLGYDLASLLNDPYVSLDETIKDRLTVKYLQVLSDYVDVDDATFMESYYWLSLQRNLQIIGAFSHLSNIKGKRFFRGFLLPAVLHLGKLLKKPLGGRFPVLGTLAESLPEKIAQINLNDHFY